MRLLTLAGMDGNWRILAAETVFSARPHVVVTRERVRVSDGRIVDDFYRVDLAPFSVCVPLLADGNVLMIWQYKHGPRAHGLSFPAGYVDSGEEPQSACARELREETGHEADEWRHLGEFVDNGNQRGCVGNYYLASGCRAVTDPDHDDLEQMEMRAMSPAAIDLALARGDINIIHHAAAWGLARPLVMEAHR
jgi:ADP-ribose pyrophosphatase